MAQKRLSSLPQKDPAVPKSDLQPEYQLASTVYTGSPFCSLQAILATSHSEVCTQQGLFAGAVKYFDIQTTIGKYRQRICPRVRGLCYEQSLGMLKLTLPKRKKQSSEGLQQLDLPSFHPTPHSRILGMLSLSI